MVSRRNFFSIVIMMAVLMLMFLLSQLMKGNEGRYDTNEYAAEEQSLSADDQWEEADKITGMQDGGYIVLLGGKNDKITDAVSQWCTYTKRDFIRISDAENYPDTKKKPEMILIDTTGMSGAKLEETLQAMIQKDVTLVLCNLPDVQTVTSSSLLKEIAGIRKIRRNQTEITGVHLFSGFFLGGEVIYEAKTKKEKKRQDMDLQIPWYVTDAHTKVYMVGRMEDESLKREDYPALIWRNTYKDTLVYTVCGDYMESTAGIGILSAFAYESNPYEIYPVVNAQNITIANFPALAEENTEEMKRIYSRNLQMVIKDVMWPSVSAMAESNELKPTIFINPQYNYSDENLPDDKLLKFCLEQTKELDSEAGLSLKYDESSSFEKMMRADSQFLEEINSTYAYQAVYGDKTEIANVKKYAHKTGSLANITTYICKDQESPLLSYLSDDVTLQNITGNAKKHTYRNDFTCRSIQTALGYSNVLVDLQDALWPEKTAHEWQNLYDIMASNIASFWNGETAFEQTTLSESDRRVRNLLSLEYADVREDDKLVLKIDNVTEQTWFILRTHEEDIVKISGGNYTEIEEDAYLICAKENVLKIQLKSRGLSE